MRKSFETKNLLIENLEMLFQPFELEEINSKKQILEHIRKVNGWSSNNPKAYYFYNQFIKDIFFDEQTNLLINKI